MSREDEGDGSEEQSRQDEPNSLTNTPPALSNNGGQESNDSRELGHERYTERHWFPQGIKKAEWIMIAFTAVTAIAAWAGVWVSHGQLAAMIDASQQTDRAIDATNRLANLAADANGVAVDALNTQKGSADAALAEAKEQATAALAKADQANQIATTALRAVQRAFIVIDQLATADVTQPDGAQRRFVGEYFMPVIQNSGNTPATITRAILITPRSRWFEGGPSRNERRLANMVNAPPNPADMIDTDFRQMDAAHIRNAVLGPKGAIQPTEGNGSDAVLLETLGNPPPGSYGLYFFGAIEYTDIFKAKHIAMYCFTTSSIIGAGTTGTHIQPARCAHWNCADEQCDADKAAYNADMKAVLAKPSTFFGPLPAPPQPRP